jgi:hypothetical protein
VSALAQERYGRRSKPGRRPWIVLAVVLVAALCLGFIGWVTILERPHVTFEDIGFNVRSPAQVEVTFDVGFHGGTTSGICTVQALNELGTEVGREDVVIRAGAHNPIRTVVSLTTSERATTGLVQACTKA